MLTERRASILGMVVNAYIDTATPVSSRSLIDRNRLPVSPATVRNEMARLEEEGYVTHPYTSAGRVPSDRGYRVYVESLMDEQPLTAAERRTIEHQFHQAAGGIDEWLSLAASVLASLAENAAVVTRARATAGRLRHVQLVQLREEAALLVAVMDDGRVRQRVVSLLSPTDQLALDARAQLLNAICAGRRATAVRDAARTLDDAEEARLVDVLADLIDEQRTVAETYMEGLQAVLEQPEFASSTQMLEAVRHLEAYELQQALPSAGELGADATRVVIGSENENEWLREWSVVIATYGSSSGLAGTVAILGPTRMHYARAVPRVRYVATLISSLMHEVGA